MYRPTQCGDLLFSLFLGQECCLGALSPLPGPHGADSLGSLHLHSPTTHTESQFSDGSKSIFPRFAGASFSPIRVSLRCVASTVCLLAQSNPPSENTERSFVFSDPLQVLPVHPSDPCMLPPCALSSLGCAQPVGACQGKGALGQELA